MSYQPQPSAPSLPFEEKAQTIQARFEVWRESNPEVVSAIVEIAREAKQRGYRQWSINGVFEILRWSKKYRALRERLNVTEADGFRLNNIYRSRVARLVMERCPDLDGFFKTRELLSE